MIVDTPKPGDRVVVCANPRCGHSGGITGTVDSVGRFDEMEEVCASVLRDGGGMCGPFRLDELLIVERKL